jgi:electron transport complex protein RnfC
MDAPTVDEMPCIRCGDCATVCPAQLQPQQLWFDLRAGQSAQAERHGLTDCSECARCDAVCPSQIALAGRFGLAKAELFERARQRQAADAARERYLARGLRLQREAIERAARDNLLAQDAASTDAVAAAIERAKARRSQPRERP